jgi:hypothetical protein
MVHRAAFACLLALIPLGVPHHGAGLNVGAASGHVVCPLLADDTAFAIHGGSTPAGPPLVVLQQAPAAPALLRTGLRPVAAPPWHPAHERVRSREHGADATTLALHVATLHRLAFCQDDARVRTGACSSHATSLPPPIPA